jgi:hypothetical protein
MKRLLLGVSVLALSASGAWAQGQMTPQTVPPPPPGQRMDQPAVPPPPPSVQRPDQPAVPPPSAAPSYGKAQSDIPPYTPEVGPRQGDWETFVGGSGTSTSKFKDNTAGAVGSIGYYALKWLPISLRQSFAATFGDKVNNRFSYSTTGAIDLQAPLGRFQPFIGGFGGYSYGHQSSWLGGGEAGIKYFVNESTFLEGLFQYGWLSDKNMDWDNGVGFYTIGAGFNF